MARVISDVASGRRSIDQPNNVAVAKMPILMTLAATLALNDIVALATLAPGVRLVDYDIISEQLDSNGAPTLACAIGVENVGGTDLGTVYETAIPLGRTASGSIGRCNNGAAAHADVSAERKIALKVTTAAATAAMVGKRLTVLLHLQA